jgi:hypothetical protein
MITNQYRLVMACPEFTIYEDARGTWYLWERR